MPVIWKDRQIGANQIHRFVQLDTYLSAISLNELDISGLNKSDESKIIYQPEHVYPPKSLCFVGRDWRVINSKISVSFGGTLSPTADGFQMAIMLAQVATCSDLGVSALVVSGGGRGIDMAAHLGALDLGGRTIAVVANPVGFGLHPYVPQRSFLEDGILSYGGGIISEYSDFVADYRQRAVDRGRIITALSDVFIVIECSANSVTVDTAKRGKIQGRQVFAIDWDRIGKKHHAPKTTGFKQLLSERIATPFPREEVSGIDDPSLAKQFADVIVKYFQNEHSTAETGS